MLLLFKLFYSFYILVRNKFAPTLTNLTLRGILPFSFIYLKIMPIDGAVLVNGEPQKTASEVTPEMCISTELHQLRQVIHGAWHQRSFAGKPRISD